VKNVDDIAIEEAMADAVLQAVLALFRITNVWPKRTAKGSPPDAALKRRDKIIVWTAMTELVRRSYY